MEQQAAREASKEERVKGYRVKVEYQPVAESEKQVRREAVGQVILQALRRLKERERLKLRLKAMGSLACVSIAVVLFCAACTGDTVTNPTPEATPQPTFTPNPTPTPRPPTDKPLFPWYRHSSADGDLRVFTYTFDILRGLPPIIPEDTNELEDVFVYNFSTYETIRVSIASDGSEGNGPSGDWTIDFGSPIISRDGRYVAFGSVASNLVPDDTNGVADVFIHDLKKSETTRISVTSTGEEADGPSFSADISPDGRYVVFLTEAPNLATGAAQGIQHLVLHDRATGQTEPLPFEWGFASNGFFAFPPAVQASISTDGRWVAIAVFLGVAVLYDRELGRTIPLAEISGETSMSADGRYIAFQSREPDSGDIFNIFIYDRDRQEFTKVSVAEGGHDANGHSDHLAMSPDGALLVFDSAAYNLAPDDLNCQSDLFLFDRVQGQLSRIIEHQYYSDVPRVQSVLGPISAKDLEERSLVIEEGTDLSLRQEPCQLKLVSYPFKLNLSEHTEIYRVAIDSSKNPPISRVDLGFDDLEVGSIVYVHLGENVFGLAETRFVTSIEVARDPE